MDENGGNKTEYEVNRKPTPKKGGFKTFLWNPETKEFFGRTGLSWFKITVFYLIFYFFLACFFLFCYYLFSLTLSDKKPRWLGNENIIGTNPGIGFRPMPDPNKNEMSSLIWINGHKDATESFWSDQLDEFLDKYENQTGKVCSFANGNVADEQESCDIDVSEIPECNSANNNYGYTGAAGTPCVLIKLNKIFDWKPEPYLADDLKLAEDRGMPEFLQAKIKELSGTNEVQTTWISCEGENHHDREFVSSKDLKYWAPGFKEQFPGIPNYYFPYAMQEKGYESPFVFVQFPKLPNDVLIQVECKAWAKNIKADRFQRLGSVHFELLYTN